MVYIANVTIIYLLHLQRGLQLVTHIITHTTFGFTDVILLISIGTSYIAGLEKG